MDEQLRRLERSTDPIARAQLIRHRLRAGTLTSQQVVAAAALGYGPALALHSMDDICASCGRWISKHPTPPDPQRNRDLWCLGHAMHKQFREPWWHRVHTHLTIEQQIELSLRLVEARVRSLSGDRWLRWHAHRWATVQGWVSRAKEYPEGWVWLAEREPGLTIETHYQDFPVQVALHHVGGRDHTEGDCVVPTALQYLHAVMGMCGLRAEAHAYGEELVSG